MPGDFPKRGAPDRTRINIDDDHDPRYWSRKLNVSRTDLKRADDKVGTVPEDVVRELASRPRR